MTRVAWDERGKRFYETGVDRAVLYPDGSSGVAWPGLTAVNETSSGGDARPYYIDGFKYVNVETATEFLATLEAFSAPVEFSRCDGIESISNGLFATEQPRRPFGLCYRTLVGNDTEGTDHGYKLHLVYNALAEPAPRRNSSVGSSPEPMNLSWGVTTMPPAMTGRRPTAHFTVDSRYTPKLLLATLEDILYGNGLSPAAQPSVQEIIELFQSPGPIVRRSFTTNPSFETGTTSWTWGSVAGLTSQSQARVVDASSPSGTALHRTSWIGKNTGAPYLIDNYRDARPNEPHVATMYVRSNKDTEAYLKIWGYSAVGSGSVPITGQLTTLVAGIWTRLVAMGTSASMINFLRASLMFPTGAVFGPTNLLKNPRGFSAGQAWGTGGNTSTANMPVTYEQPTSQTIVSEVTTAVRRTIATVGEASAYLRPHTGGTLTDLVSVTPGQIVQFGCVFASTWAMTDGRAFIQWYDAAGVFVGSSTPTVFTPSGSGVWVSHEGTVPAGAALASAYVGTSSLAGGAVGDYFSATAAILVLDSTPLTAADFFDGDSPECQWTGTPRMSSSIHPHVIELDAVTIEEATEVLPYFDGDTPPSDGYSYSWESTPHASASIARSWGPI